jgi:hypothetical protein
LTDDAGKLSGVRPSRIPAPLHLGPVPEASSQARRFVRDALRLIGAESLTDSAELGVSELVTNACMHARTAITVALTLTRAGGVRIEVSDDSPRQPLEQSQPTMATTGRGLRLLSAYGSWGIQEPIDGRIGKTIWFQPSAKSDRGRQHAADEWPDQA